jgi:hypothetical protein
MKLRGIQDAFVVVWEVTLLRTLTPMGYNAINELKWNNICNNRWQYLIDW